MDRYIGIDYGRKRTGIAASDPLGIFASALDTIDSTKLIDYLKNYANGERIVAFVVGYPVNLNGQPSEAQADVDVFLKRLEKAFPGVPVHLEDERFTSVLAQRVMIDGGMKKSERREKGSVDRISAALILQSYLDRLNGSVGLGGIDPLSVPESLSKNKTRRKK
jgi:putative Holliday junction resolvase